MSFAEWRRRRQAREALRSGDPWVCPYCRVVHPEFDVGGTKHAFGYPSVRFRCCGKVAFMYKDAHSGQLLRFTRIGEGVSDWMPKEQYFRWVEESAKARGHREGSPHKHLVEARPIDKEARRAAKAQAVQALEAPPEPATAPEAPKAPAPAQFLPAAKLDELKPGQGRAVEVQGHRIALFHVGEQVHAIDDTCAHAGQSLGASVLEEGIVTCNGHGWRYDVRTGQCENRPDVKVRSYPVKVEDGVVKVGV